MCAYYSDGSTMDKRCCADGQKIRGESSRVCGEGVATAECVPGCPTGHAPAFWCAELSDFGCAWRGGQLASMLRQGAAVAADKGVWPPEYNEVVLDPAPFVHELPHAIEAFYVRASADAADVSRVQAIYQDYLQRYGLSREAVPFLRYSPNMPEAFREVE